MADPMARSPRHCSSVPRPPAFTCPTSWPNWGERSRRSRRRRSPSGPHRGLTTGPSARTGPTSTYVGPDLVVSGNRWRPAFATTFGCRAVAVGKGLRVQPGLERLLIAPAGEHQPLLPPISGLEQLETFESVGVVDSTGPRREAVCQLVPGVDRHGNGVDLDDGHLLIVPHAAWRNATEGVAVVRCLSRD